MIYVFKVPKFSKCNVEKSHGEQLMFLKKIAFEDVGIFLWTLTRVLPDVCAVYVQMSKSIKRLEKEKAALKLKCDKSEMSMMELVEDVSTSLRFSFRKSRKEMMIINRTNQTVTLNDEGLCAVGKM